MRRYKILGAAALFLAVAPLSAQQPTQIQEQVHVVGNGDTLWDLAQRYLRDPYRWPEIFSRNSELISNPHWIYPRQRILIPGARATAAADATAVAAPASTGQPRTVFYQGDASRLAEQARVMTRTQADEVPIVRSGTFYAAGLLVADSLMTPLGRLEEAVSPSVVTRVLGKQIQPFDHVHVSMTGRVEEGGRVHFMRAGREVAPYGRIFIPTGTGVVIETADGRATVEIDGMYDRIQPGDLMVPMPAFAVPTGVVPGPASGLEGTLLAFEPEQPVASRDDLAYVDLGRENGITEGDEFVAYLPASVAEWGTRPAVDVARLQVVRAGTRTSAVRVVSMQQPALTEGLPIRLVARMP